MLKKFQVRNYKNFRDTLTFDFGKVGGYRFNQECICDDVIGTCIVYGRNATGKTNLGHAIGDIFDVIISNSRFRGSEEFLNADSSESVAQFCYEFEFDGISVVYEYSKREDGKLTIEQLLVDGKMVYCLDFERRVFTDLDLDIIGVEMIQLDRYVDSISSDDSELEDSINRLSFLRYILNNSAIASEAVIRKLEDYVRRMRFYGVGHQFNSAITLRENKAFVEYLAKEDNLADFQEFLNVMGISCELDLESFSDGESNLCFKHNKPIPFFGTASSGTVSLVNLYKRFVVALKRPSFIYMDEFDAFYHYEMSEKVVQFFKHRFSQCQVVMTTHNTNLMSNQLMRPDCLFILSGEGKLTALCDATERELREGHNLEKLYIGGEFERYE